MQYGFSRRLHDYRAYKRHENGCYLVLHEWIVSQWMYLKQWDIISKMDDTEILSSLNEYIATEDSTPVTLASSFYQSILRDSILLHNSSQSDLLIQAFIGRYFIRSGERVVVSLANKRMIRREMYPEIKHTLLEMMLVMAMATLGYVLVKLNAAAKTHENNN